MHWITLVDDTKTGKIPTKNGHWVFIIEFRIELMQLLKTTEWGQVNFLIGFTYKTSNGTNGTQIFSK